MLGIVYKVVEQFFSKKSTNMFPSKYITHDTKAYLQGMIQPPIAVKEDFRGRLAYNFDSCTGCGMCSRVCPANAIELYPASINGKKSKRIVIYLSRCTFCQECVNICPKKSITMTDDFFMADYDKYSELLIVGLIQRQKYETHSQNEDAYVVEKARD